MSRCAGERYDLVVSDKISESLYAAMEAMPRSTVYHTRPWHRLLERTGGWKTKVAIAQDSAGELVWLLPFVSKRRLGTKKWNVCLPLSDKVGPLWRSDFRPALLPPIPRTLWPLEVHECVEAESLRRHKAFYESDLDLTQFDDVEALRKSFHPSRVQRKIRKAERSGLHVEIAEDAVAFHAFEQLQAETRQRQGSPTYPRGFFRIMFEELAPVDAVRLHLVKLEGKPVAGIVFLFHRETAIYGYGASVNDRDVWRLGANQLAMWSAIGGAYTKGCRRVEFGTSSLTNPDLKNYKEAWGAVSRELQYSFGITGAKDPSLRLDDPKVRLVSAVLRRVPRPVFDRLSQILVRIAA